MLRCAQRRAATRLAPGYGLEAQIISRFKYFLFFSVRDTAQRAAVPPPERPTHGLLGRNPIGGIVFRALRNANPARSLAIDYYFVWWTENV